MSERDLSNLYDVSGASGSPGTTNLVYILNLIGIVVPILYLVSVLIAFVSRDEAPDWLRSHYENQISIFWKGLLYWVVAFALCFVLVGFVLWLLLVIWWVMRNVKGMQALARGEAYPTPRSWGFS